MLISLILATKGRDVVTAAPHRSLGEAVMMLSEKGIGVLVVASSDGDVLGILSERDIVRALARRGEGALQDAVSRHMTTKVVTATDQMSVVEAMSLMSSGRFRHIPVVEEGRLAGLISIGDVVKHRLQAIEQEKQSMLEYIGTA